MEAPDPVLPPRRRARRIAVGVAGVLVLVLIGLWLFRLPIATRFVDRELAAARVPARYRVAGLGVHGQRLEDVVIGDPARPDLVADWIETETGIGLSGPYLAGVRAGHVRLRARVVDGQLRLGAIDRLLPPPSGKPFALPAIGVASDDVRIRLETPAGVVGLKLAGRGRLNDGFRGSIAAVAPRLAAGGCVAGGVRGAMAVAIEAAAPRIDGPVQMAALACGATGSAQVRGVRADLMLAFGAALDRMGGRVRIATGPARMTGATAVRAAGLDGTIVLDTRPIRWPGGDLSLAGRGLTVAGADGGWGRAARATVRSAWTVDQAGIALGMREQERAGRPSRMAVAVRGAAIAPQRLGRWLALPLPPGTPLSPLAARVSDAARIAGRDFDGDAIVRAQIGEGYQLADLLAASLRARSGATVRIETAFGGGRGPDGQRWLEAWGPEGRGGGAIMVAGGGLPTINALLANRRRGRPWRLRVRADPYAAGGARLALTPVTIVAGARGWQVATTATLSGPVAGGRVDGLRLPLMIRADGGVIAANTACMPVAADRLALSGLVLDRPAVTLCPLGRALVRVADGRVSGAARLPEVRLRGRLGGSALAIDAQGARFDLADRGFVIEGLRTTLGAPERETRINAAQLDGQIVAGRVAGRFAGGAGQIGAVPLALGELTGGWRLANGVLDLDGALVVSDTASPARFQPMRGEAVRLRLADGAIVANGRLVEPTTATPVATVALSHRLADGSGHAAILVPGITFGDGFQPELLTRVTFGVIADVKGTMTGQGRIDWGQAGVTSAGRFGTEAIDLAAAFGPVQGIVGTLTFEDLLGLRTAPGQTVTVKSINPGIEVTDGVVRFRTLSPTQVAVESGRWPFAGGTLTLAPTTLDFGQDAARRMTFTVTGAAADQFLQQFDFDNLNATGTFDGTLPMVFDQSGGGIADGRLQVRPGGGSIAYAGDLTQKDLGFWGNLAFQSLRSLRYRDLSVVMNGPLSGEMVTAVRFAGVSQGEGAQSNVLIRRLQRLPFVFNIRIAAPFRGLLDSARGFYDPSLLIRRNLPALMDAQRRQTAPGLDAPPAAPSAASPASRPSIQPPASEPVP